MNDLIIIALVVLGIPIACCIFAWVIGFIRKAVIQNKEESKRNTNLSRLTKDISQTHPWLAEEVADIDYIYDESIAMAMRTKKRPAMKSAEELSRIAKEKKELKKENKQLKYQLETYEKIFPWLLDFKEESAENISGYIFDDDAYASEYDSLKTWLSQKEYQSLPSAKRYQLALDRYLGRKKTNWEAGIAYERYIGYIYESRGYSVEYVGALSGLEDRGIDIIAKKNRERIVIQCKRYSSKSNHIVHENTVSQLYGTCEVYRMENPNISVKPVIYTSSLLSQEGRSFANRLKIEVYENYPLCDYPMVKCNINKQGEKIYHLPFDQQYDKVNMNKKGNMYVRTCAEAENKGFRHAYKWRPVKN